MKKQSVPSIIILLSLLIISVAGGCTKTGVAEKPRTTSFDDEWRFLKDNPSGAETPDFDDSKWRQIDLPHDWSIEDLPNQTPDSIIGPFSKTSIGKMSTGYTVGGTAWYRKNFTINTKDKGKIAYLRFDGIYMNSDVWINGKHVGNHPYGYTSFWYDITQYLNPEGQANLIAVQVKNEGLNTRWYSGSGIYRHTWLTLADPVHVAPWGVYITTPDVSEKKASVEIVTNVTNTTNEDSPVTLIVKLTDPSGVAAGTTSIVSVVPAGKSAEIKQNIEVNNPALWSIENTALYKAQVEIIVDKKITDNVESAFGIRTISFDAQTGFRLNGRSIELRGGCFHHDNGPLGSAAIDRAEERKIEILKKAGFNAIRCSHNPPSPGLLDACDRLGMLVIDEICDMWEKPKNPNDYSQYFKEWWQKDLQSMVLRDRNHPSIIMWSIGNEIFESTDSSGLRIATDLSTEVRRLDTTRAITQGMVDFSGWNPGAKKWESQSPIMDLLDVQGYNYAFAKYEEDHLKYPSRVIYASESMPPLSLQNWQAVEKLPYVIGNFTWTAMDYLGEAGVGSPRLLEIDNSGSNRVESMMFFNSDSWPAINNFQGDLDLIGNPKTPYFYQHVVWRESKVEMLVHNPIPDGKREITSPWGFPDELKSWNWSGHEGEKFQVHVYTRSKLVKLELNGKLIGEQAVDGENSITATFEIPYEAGTLTARCFDNGVETGSETIKTTGLPAVIKLTADRSSIKATRNDLSYVMVEIVDSEGNVVPNANNIIVSFDIVGNGEIAGVGSGNPTDLSGYQQPRKKTWQGRCLAIVRPKGEAGKIVLTARAEGLKESVIEITTGI